MPYLGFITRHALAWSYIIAMNTAGRSLLCYLTILLVCSTAFAAPGNIIRLNGSKETSLDSALYLFRDASRNMKVDDLLEHPEYFSKVNPEHLQLGYKQINAWLKFSIQYSSNIPRIYYFVIRNATINDIEFRIYDAAGTCIKYVQTGIDFPFYKRDVDTRFFVFRIPVKPGHEYTVYTKLHNRLGNLSTTIGLMSQHAYNQFYAYEEFVAIIFFAIMFLSICVSFILMVIFREAVYAYYCAYLFCLSFHLLSIEGFTFQYIFPENPALANLSRGILIIPCFIFIILFLLKLLSRPDVISPLIRKFFNIQIGVYVLLFTTIFIPKADAITQLTVVIMYVNIFFSIFMMIWVLVSGIREQHKPSYYLSLAILPNLALGIISLLRNFGWLHTNQPVMMYGIMLEVIFLFAALLSRFKLHLAQNDTLKKKVNHYQGLIEDIRKNHIPDVEKTIARQGGAKFPSSDIENHYRVLKELMEKNKIYLDRDLSLNSLAGAMNISIHLLSHIINQKESKNFTEFINYYRVLEAQKLLTDPLFSNYSVEGIGYESGFNTRTTFYNAFKKQTGKTPVAFKKGE